MSSIFSRVCEQDLTYGRNFRALLYLLRCVFCRQCLDLLSQMLIGLQDASASSRIHCPSCPRAKAPSYRCESNGGVLGCFVVVDAMPGSLCRAGQSKAAAKKSEEKSKGKDQDKGKGVGCGLFRLNFSFGVCACIDKHTPAQSKKNAAKSSAAARAAKAKRERPPQPVMPNWWCGNVASPDTVSRYSRSPPSH